MRIAHRVDAVALGQRLVGGAKTKRSAPFQAARCDAQQGQVAAHVEVQQLQLPFLPVGGGKAQPIAGRLQRELADDVIVGQHMAVGADQKARADRGLAVLRLQQGAHLQQLRARAFVDTPRGGRHSGRRGRNRGSPRSIRNHGASRSGRCRCRLCQNDWADQQHRGQGQCNFESM